MERLREEFEAWFRADPANALPGVSEGQWMAFVRRVLARLQLTASNPLEAIRARFGPDAVKSPPESKAMYEAIRQIELVVRSEKDREFRKMAALQLHRIYSLAFDEFPFRGKGLVTLRLDSIERGESRRLGPRDGLRRASRSAVSWRSSRSARHSGSTWAARCGSVATPS